MALNQPRKEEAVQQRMKNVDKEIISIAQSRNVSKSNLSNMLYNNNNFTTNIEELQQQSRLQNMEKDVEALKRQIQAKDEEIEKSQESLRTMEGIISKLQETVQFLVEKMQEMAYNFESIKLVYANQQNQHEQRTGKSQPPQQHPGLDAVSLD